MSGIYGCLFKHHSKPPADAATLDRMGRALAFGAAGASSTPQFVILGPAALGAAGFPHLRSAVVTLAGEGGPSAVALVGHIAQFDGDDVSRLDGAALGERLLRGYLERGTALLAALRGEFALAFWDAARSTLLLATDRIRMHPLLVYEDADRVVFASRMNALITSGLATHRTIVAESILDVVATSYIASPGSIFREVQKVPPGHWMRWQAGARTSDRYWDLSFLNPSPTAPRELAGQLRELVREAIALRLPPEGNPSALGTFLSGGIDSSTVTGVLTQILGHPVRSFSIGFTEPRYDEMEYARIAARAFGSEHHEYYVTPADAARVIPVLVASFDEPYANASAVPTYYCAHLARENGVETLLAGDGGDELFAGNPWYGTRRAFDHYRRLPRWFREGLFRPLVRASARTGVPVFRKAERYVERARLSHPDRLATYSLYEQIPPRHLFDAGFLASLAGPYAPHRATREHYDHAPARDELDRLLYVDIKLVIGDNDLLKVARMTEAAGLAVRFPLLDHVLAEFAASVPAAVKMPGSELRTFFKRAYSDLLPAETRAKRKHGFGLPIPLWLKSDPGLRDLMHELLLGRETRERGIFRREGLEDLVARHEADETHYYGAIVWNVMAVELWLREHA